MITFNVVGENLVNVRLNRQPTNFYVEKQGFFYRIIWKQDGIYYPGRSWYSSTSRSEIEDKVKEIAHQTPAIERGYFEVKNVCN